MKKDKKQEIVPRGKWILVRPEKADQGVTAAGITLPANEEREQKAIGTVEAVGGDVSGVEKGDKVLYGVFAGEKISSNEDGKKVERLLVLDEDVIAFLR